MQVLAARAAWLNRAAGAPPIPSLFFFTDPVRTPDPCAAAKRLPRGACVVYRHFGAPERAHIARRLAAIARSSGLTLLIAADPELALRVGADGAHWPENRLRPRSSERLMTAAAHSHAAIARAVGAGADACALAYLPDPERFTARAAWLVSRESDRARVANPGDRAWRRQRQTRVIARGARLCRTSGC